ncbi:D-serine ammonia-lyase [Brachybacterium sp. EF45031]|uniref:D-serine ammonia-lyase n=1 Tax=Brachybacterium sillae TaxID=2810536 RepID=UPI00217D28DF|nr:D-serine ammonia-lyase [Brachybacterium sillae]MCS6712304.1 D-serine ammonia-lyase [Brachybacterium sillae]
MSTPSLTPQGDPVLEALVRRVETLWLRRPAESVPDLAPDGQLRRAVDDARARLQRFAPWFEAHFPATRATGGILESPLQAAPALEDRLSALHGVDLAGRLWLKRDDILPVSGSIKARGGIHEVLAVAERVGPQRAPEHGIVVGSTGNLGLSIGIVATEFGFRTTVHMSADAKQWKKDLLRARGAEVVEHAGDFTAAVEAGRAAAAADPSTHFIDDEASVDLFSGYAVAARRLRHQLEALEVPVDTEHPLIVYLPCGVGGGPGGVTFGLALEFGPAVHCVLVEPVEAPAMMLGVRTGRHAEVSVQDIGLSGRTAADGLAVGRPSRLVGERVGPLVSGFATISDERMLALVALLEETEGVCVEPSAAAGLALPWRVQQQVVTDTQTGLTRQQLQRATHVAWLTGGDLVPPAERQAILAHGRAALSAVRWGMP